VRGAGGNKNAFQNSKTFHFLPPPKLFASKKNMGFPTTTTTPNNKPPSGEKPLHYY
jgi:hypothetical protein